MVKNIAFQALFKAQRFHPVSAAALNTRPHIPPLKGTSQKKTPQEQKHQKYRPLLQRKVWTLYNVTSSKPSVHRVHTSIFISNHINMIRKTIYIKKKKQAIFIWQGNYSPHNFVKRIIYFLHSHPACPPAAPEGYKKLPESVVLPHPCQVSKNSAAHVDMFFLGYPIISHMKGWFSL